MSVAANLIPHLTKTTLTKKEIPNSVQLHTTVEFGMSEHLPAHGVFAHIGRIDTDSLCTRVNVNDAWRKTSLEFVG